MLRKGIWLLFVLLLALPAASLSQSMDLEERLAEERAKLRAAMQAEQSVLKQIYAVEHIQYQHERKLRKISAQLAATRQTIADDKETIARMETELPIRGARLARRLAALYRMGRGGFWKVLMTSESFGAFVRHYRALRKIVEMDAEDLSRHRVEILALRERRGALLRRQAQLSALARQEKEASLAVEIEKRKKMFLLEDIQNNKQIQIRLTQELARQDAALGQTVASLPPSPPPPTPTGPLRLDFAEHRGYLPRPVAGPIVGRFGVRVNDRFGTKTRSNGIDIAAPLGTPVQVVADGVVRYVGEFMGYGRVAIVDHGERYHTLYAHLGQFNVSRGEAVRTRTVIGTVGSSGLYAQPVLHFEIRHQGRAVNPLAWLAASP